MTQMMEYTEQDMEIEAAAEVGHQHQCFEYFAEELVEAGEVDGYDVHGQIAHFQQEAAKGFRAGRSCHCVDSVTGYYLPDLAEMRAAGVEI